MQLNKSTLALGASIALCGALSSPASAQNETGLGGAPTWSVIAPSADFVATSTTTRLSIQNDPITGPIAGPPPGTHVVDAFAVWNYMLNGPVPAFDVIEINGTPVLGNKAGVGTPDLWWGKTHGASFLAQGIAPLLNFSGSNTIAHVCDKAVGSDPAALGEGLSIVVIYAKDHGPLSTVNLWAGYTSMRSTAGGDAVANLDLATPYIGGPGHFFMNAMDGEDGRLDRFWINGNSVGGTLNGTGADTNAWQGFAGPGAVDNLYDFVDDDIAGLMANGDTTIHARSTRPNAGEDEIGHTLAVFASQESCGNFSIYCTSKVNSLGCTPVVSAQGTPSAGQLNGPFNIRLSNAMSQSNGILFYGYGKASVPFQGGFLCVLPPVHRTGVKNTGGNVPIDCSGQITLDFNAYAKTGVDPMLTVGQTVFAQFWVRDPNDPFGAGTTEAICFDLCK